MPGSTDVEDFARLIEALHPGLDQVVVIGGWAQRLYRLHPLAQPLGYEPLATLDTDIAVPAELRSRPAAGSSDLLCSQPALRYKARRHPPSPKLGSF